MAKAKAFPGFPRQALAFFKELSRNNDRTWFAAHKETFEKDVREPMVELVSLLCSDLAQINVDYIPDKPEKVIYRIYRDTRFSKDKTPYKTHIAAHFQHRHITKNRGAGFYFAVSHESLAIGGGMYMPEPEQLLAVRNALLTRWSEFQAICSERSLVRALGPLQGEKLARVPKGFDRHSPVAELLRFKHFYFYTELDPAQALRPSIHGEILKRFKLLLPMVRFLNAAILAALATETNDGPLPTRPEPMF